jgi:hypothetical protein
MIKCYEELWPDHPFTFRIPYQDINRIISSPKREYIKTSPDIKKTVLSLLEDLNDEEWVYWCIDDKYPVNLNLGPIKELYQSVVNGELEQNSSVLFCRARKMLNPDYLTGEKIMIKSQVLLERKAYKQIWIHQFLKVKVIRYLFNNFPDIIENAKVMDPLKEMVQKPASHKLYVTSVNQAIFGESTSKGVITGNCFESMNNHNLDIPSWFKIDHQRITIIGNLSVFPEINWNKLLGKIFNQLKFMFVQFK